MGVFSNIRGRKDAHVAEAAVQPELEPKTDASVSHPSASDTDTLSLEARNEREVEQHPDQITKQAEAGTQKVEAAALVWSKTTVWCIYAW